MLLQPSCHTDPSLGLHFYRNLQAYCHFLFSKGHACAVYGRLPPRHAAPNAFSLISKASRLQSLWAAHHVTFSHYLSPVPCPFCRHAPFNVFLYHMISSRHRHLSWGWDWHSHLNVISLLESVPVRLFTPSGSFRLYRHVSNPSSTAFSHHILLPPMIAACPTLLPGTSPYWSEPLSAPLHSSAHLQDTFDPSSFPDLCLSKNFYDGYQIFQVSHQCLSHVFQSNDAQ